jgi:hypothetical protein
MIWVGSIPCGLILVHDSRKTQKWIDAYQTPDFVAAARGGCAAACFAATRRECWIMRFVAAAAAWGVRAAVIRDKLKVKS